jgi:ADP-ribosylation factor related protein 1
VITSPRLLNLPLLLIANKQDTPTALAVNEVRESFEAFQRASLAAAAGEGPSSAGIMKDGQGERQSMALDIGGEGRDELAKMERMATLDVLGMSALTGCVLPCSCSFYGRTSV